MMYMYRNKNIFQKNSCLNDEMLFYRHGITRNIHSSILAIICYYCRRNVRHLRFHQNERIFWHLEFSKHVKDSCFESSLNLDISISNVCCCLDIIFF